MAIRFCACCLAIYRQDFQRCPLDGGTLVLGANDPWIGLTVGTCYVIDELLGEGAMARVYRAHHRNFRDRRYAIKILIGDLAASAQMRTRFALEAEHAARLSHPNVVGVRDFGATERGIHHMVMELVEGPTLGTLLRRGPMDPERVIGLAQQIAEGLEHAHGRGVIHRDLKPDNILVLAEREHEIARIADFGLALSKDKETRLTTTGVVCTPAYAAPEQLRGDAIDHRVDLYALGVSMFEMLSGGILPFAGDVDASVTCKLTGNAPSVLMVAPNVPPALVAIIGRLLSPEPDRRPRDARAVIRVLEQALTAPRLELRTEQIAPLRSECEADARPARAGKPTANLRSSVSQVAVPSDNQPQVQIDSLVPTRKRRVRRIAVQLFACALTLGGVLAWADMRNPVPVRAEPALVPMPAAPAALTFPDDEVAPEVAVIDDVTIETLVGPRLATCDTDHAIAQALLVSDPPMIAHPTEHPIEHLIAQPIAHEHPLEKPIEQPIERKAVRRAEPRRAPEEPRDDEPRDEKPNEDQPNDQKPRDVESPDSSETAQVPEPSGPPAPPALAPGDELLPWQSIDGQVP